MSVATETSEIDYTGNAATTAFPVPFPWLDDDQLVVTLLLDGAAVATTQVIGTHYTLVGEGAASGTLTMLTAPPADSTLHIERTVDFLQDMNLTAQGVYDPETIEAAHDYCRFCDQQLDRRVSSLEALGAGLVEEATTLTRRQLSKQFTTHATDVEETFNGSVLTMALPAGFTASGCIVVRVRNITTPTARFTEPVGLDWQQVGATIVINFLSGLDVGIEYLVDFEATGLQA